jgi:hypothetical protein
MVKALGLKSDRLSRDPLAAKIAGRVFTLNYIPLRDKETVERTTIRKAMAAADGVVRLLRYSDEEGRETYVRTAQFVLFLAIEKLWPAAKAKMRMIQPDMETPLEGALIVLCTTGQGKGALRLYSPLT